jgi:predicted phage terminase large subunit-like protein
MSLAIDEVSLVRNICKKSFFEFVREFWSVRIPEKPVWNWHIPYICNNFQASAERVFAGEPRLHDYIVNVPPGSTKSTILSIMAPAWVWTRMPSARFICSSYTLPLALDLGIKARDIINSEKYQKCFPEVQFSTSQNTKGYYANTRNGMRLSVGTGTSVVGFHAHFIIIDDPIDPLGAISSEECNTANKYISETLYSRKIDKSVTVQWLVMQRLAQNDPTGYALENVKPGEPGYRHICLPSRISPEVKPKHLRGRYVDGLLDPHRLSDKILTEAHSRLFDFGFACQHMQTPIPLGGGAFHTDKLFIEPPSPNRKDWKRIMRYWDKAGTQGGGMFTVGIKMGQDVSGRYWVLDIIRGQWDSFTRENIIKQTAMMDGRNIPIGIEQEGGSGGKESAESTIRNLAGWTVIKDLPKGKKEMRADPYATQVNAGNVRLAPGPWNAAYISELKFFPHGTYMDQVDASSGCFAWLAKPVITLGAL